MSAAFGARFTKPDIVPVAFHTQCLLRVSWTEPTALKAQRIWHTEQPKAIVERAAVALAALMLAKLLPEGQMRMTKIGERADYWLPHL